MTCKQRNEWLDRCGSQGGNAQWILENTKKCPKCNTRIEKNQGCNKVSCKQCGHHFCWICQGPWSEHGNGNYYGCNKFKKKGQGKENKAGAGAGEIAMEAGGEGAVVEVEMPQAGMRPSGAVLAMLAQQDQAAARQAQRTVSAARPALRLTDPSALRRRPQHLGEAAHDGGPTEGEGDGDESEAGDEARQGQQRRRGTLHHRGCLQRCLEPWRRLHPSLRNPYPLSGF